MATDDLDPAGGPRPTAEIAIETSGLKTVCFLDTNTLLHFRRPDEIDWLALCEGQDVELRIAHVVLRELDRQKELHPLKRIRKRAENAVAWLASLGADTQALIRERTTVAFDDGDPLIDFPAHQLQPGIQDDWLLASVIERTQRLGLGARVVLATADISLGFKARMRRIDVIRPPDSALLPVDQTEEEKKSASLAAQLVEAKSAKQAQPNVVFSDGSRLLKLEFLPTPVSIQSANTPAQERGRLQPLPVIEVIDGNGEPRPNLFNDQLRDYNERLEAYQDQYRAFYTRLVTGVPSVAVITLAITNGGTEPAADVDLHLMFSVPATIDQLEPEIDVPVRPTPPIPPVGNALFQQVSAAQKAPEGFSHRSGLLRTLALSSKNSDPNISAPRIESSAESSAVHFHLNRAKHHEQCLLPELFVIFDRDAAKPFNIQFILTAANLTRPVEGRLDVVIAG